MSTVDNMHISCNTDKIIQISIIVPIYRVEQYLSSCIKSILKQTYSNFELILIDDGSPDHCGKICDEFARKDSRIKVIHQTNGGVSKARNIGIKIAKGKWICFIDPDDLITPEYLEKFDPDHINDIDLIIQGHLILRKNLYRSECKFTNCIYHIKDILTPDLLFFLVPWSKLYKKELIVKYNINFPENISQYEDMVFYHNFISHANTFRTISSQRYIYRQNSKNSLSSFIPDPMKYVIAMEMSFKYLKNIYEKNNIKNNYLFLDNITNLRRNVIYPFYFKYSKSQYFQLIDYIRKSERYKIIYFHDCNFLNKCFLYCLHYAPKLLLYFIFWIISYIYRQK